MFEKDLLCKHTSPWESKTIKGKTAVWLFFYKSISQRQSSENVPLPKRRACLKQIWTNYFSTSSHLLRLTFTTSKHQIKTYLHTDYLPLPRQIKFYFVFSDQINTEATSSPSLSNTALQFTVHYKLWRTTLLVHITVWCPGE